MTSAPASRGADEALIAGLLRGLGLPETISSLLFAHAEAVARDGARLGLVGPRDLDSVVRRHTADSLLFAKVRAPAPGESWADVGSGAGFPGFVLACCYPTTRFSLVEPFRRRAAFLQLAIDGLGLANVEVLQARAEDIPGGFDVCVARALARPEAATEKLLALTGQRGEAIIAIAGSTATPPGADRVQVDSPVVDAPGTFVLVRGKKRESELWTAQ